MDLKKNSEKSGLSLLEILALYVFDEYSRLMFLTSILDLHS